ncbi:serine hydrolase domain-containing protein [Chelativorans sp. YIM 93263]|uniref:serine hydrolase domain-containing protein n=1 Tax=Chelativorans sp. YIM 93263 TaxID=2906648 RepID=UPI0023792C8D|nr:serine hydrolase domain-containing protein [Chelativorans sp. YIM 93263]
MLDAQTHSAWITSDGVLGGSGDSSARFPYWSSTKTVIAICTLKLCERDQLSLEATPESEPYTLRQLLGHTSGLRDYGQLASYHDAVAADEEPWTRQQLMHAVRREGLLFEPGHGWSYSNIGYLLVRETLERVSGLSLAQLVDELIGDPLGLESLELATTCQQLASVYWKAARNYHPGWVYHGCLTGTAADAARLLHALFHQQILGAAALKQLLVRYPLGGAIPGRPWTECGYALGLMSGTMGRSGRAIGHSGGGPFCVNAVYHFPDRQVPMTVACFTDGTDEGQAELCACSLAGP